MKWARPYIAVACVCLIYVVLQHHGYTWYEYTDGSIDPSICLTPPIEMEDLRSLVRDSHRVLNEMGIMHFPIYGSLWGALRRNEPLQWDNDFDFALFHHDLVEMNEDLLKQMFRAKGIQIFYRPWFGAYRVTRNSARGDLMIFRKSHLNGEWMVRVGYEAYVFFLNYRRFHRFPSRLVNRPLSTIQFCGLNMTAPNEGVEILKHFYPQNWWKEVKPRGCP